MKFVISLILFQSLSALSAPINVFYEGWQGAALDLRKVLVNEYHVPEELIDVARVLSCEKLRINGKLDVCLKNNGDLLVVSVDREFIDESLRIFRAP